MGALFGVLARLKFLRGTLFDPFGHSTHRRREQRLRDDFEAGMLARCDGLKAEDIPELARLAADAEGVRGFGHVKDKALDAFYGRWKARLAA